MVSDPSDAVTALRREIARLEGFVRQLDAGDAELAHQRRRYADRLERAGGHSAAVEAGLEQAQQVLRLNRREQEMIARRLARLRADLDTLEHADAARSGN